MSDSGVAPEELVALLYAELRKLADAWMAGTPPGETLQATALVHEAYARLATREQGWDDKRHFFFAAARSMRDILVERARRKVARRARVEADPPGLVSAPDTAPVDLLALDDALANLEREDARQHQIVLLRFFAGLTARETAQTMDLSLRTVEREWRLIRAKLYRDLAGEVEP